MEDKGICVFRADLGEFIYCKSSSSYYNCDSEITWIPKLFIAELQYWSEDPSTYSFWKYLLVTLRKMVSSFGPTFSYNSLCILSREIIHIIIMSRIGKTWLQNEDMHKEYVSTIKKADVNKERRKKINFKTIYQILKNF